MKLKLMVPVNPINYTLIDCLQLFTAIFPMKHPHYIPLISLAHSVSFKRYSKQNSY
jgi:hypothetical protein